MTRQRNDNHSTEFGLWVRERKDLCSTLGYVATNLDYIWENYKTGDWMLLEEKRFNFTLRYPQEKQFKKLHNICQMSSNYKGFHLLVFEKTSPTDGKMFLNKQEITIDELVGFLKFELVVPCFFDGKQTPCKIPLDKSHYSCSIPYYCGKAVY